MAVSRTLDVDLPDHFDLLAYDQVMDLAVLWANPNESAAPWKVNAWFGFTAGWIGFAMRLRSAIEYNQEFGSLIALGSSPPRPVQYLQERAFFGCVTSALSAIECFFLASYCLANPVSKLHFPLAQAAHLNKYPRDVAAAYLRFAPRDPFSVQLSAVANSAELESLSNLRNSLAHRGALPRKAFLSTVADIPAAIPSNPKSLAMDFTHDASLSSETTAEHVRRTVQELSLLTAEFLKFLRGQGTP